MKVSKNFSIEDLGVQELDVYDIEVEGTHRFFANDILVHNSAYLNCNNIIEKFCKDKSKEEIVEFLDKLFSGPVEDYVNKSYHELSDYLNCPENRMIMEREVISDSSIWTSKKHYTMSMLDKEGVRYTKPKYKIMGLDAIKSNIPDNCRPALEKSYEICLHKTNDDLIDFINEFKKEYMSWSIEEISNTSSFNDIDKWKDRNSGWYLKGTPFHVKGALIYNKLIKDNKLEEKYELFHNGTKGKIAKLKKMNPTPDRTFCYPSFFPRELGLENYIDKEAMFRKSFLDPLHNVIDVIGWVDKKRVENKFF